MQYFVGGNFLLQMNIALKKYIFDLPLQPAHHKIINIVQKCITYSHTLLHKVHAWEHQFKSP